MATEKERMKRWQHWWWSWYEFLYKWCVQRGNK
jgi:hypothetical protein